MIFEQVLRDRQSCVDVVWARVVVGWYANTYLRRVCIFSSIRDMSNQAWVNIDFKRAKNKIQFH